MYVISKGGENIKKKYPVILQEDYKDCGAACLAMIIKHYQGNIPYEELKEQLHVSKNGIRASDILKVATKCGFEAKGMEGKWEDFKNSNILLPCIAHVLLEQSYYHYIVLYEINVKKQYLLVVDPAKGLYKMKLSEFETIWNHIILTFYPKTPITYIEQNHILKQHLIELLKSETKPFLYLCFLSVMITATSIFFSFMLEHFISMLEHHNEYTYLYCSILLYMMLLLLKNGSAFIRNKLFFHVYQRVDFHFMKTIFDQILHLPYRYYKNKTTGEMISRIQDIGVIRSFLATLTLSSLMDLPLFMMSAIVLYIMNSKLFIIAFFTLLIYVLLFIIYQNRISNKVEQLEENSAKVTSYMVEVLNGYESIFGSHLKDYAATSLDQKYIDYIDCMKQLESVQNESQTISQSVFDLSMLLLLSIGIYLVAKEQLTISALLLFHSLFLYFIDPVRNLLRLTEEWKKVKVSWRRLSNLFHSNQELGIYEHIQTGNIKFQNVTFAYQKKPILNQLSFEIKLGQKVLIVGESGNGKSTILKLLMQYYDVSRNSIYIDEIDLQDYKKEAIEESIIYVSMKEQLFSGTLYQNILLDKKQPDHYQEVLELTEVDKIISKTPLGHHLVLEENGANLSGGERQRVILARTLLLPWKILLLDEATSQIDPKMEERILTRLFLKYQAQTVIVISHRLDNAHLFDQVMKIEHGTIKKEVNQHES